MKEGPQELVKSSDIQLVGYLRSLVGNSSQVGVAHADHDHGSREAVAVQRNHVDFVVTQGAASRLLCLDQHVVIQFVGQRLQIVPIRCPYFIGPVHRHQFVETLGKCCLIALVGPLQQLVHDLNLVVHNVLQLIGLLMGCLTL